MKSGAFTEVKLFISAVKLPGVCKSLQEFAELGCGVRGPEDPPASQTCDFDARQLRKKKVEGCDPMQSY